MPLVQVGYNFHFNISQIWFLYSNSNDEISVASEHKIFNIPQEGSTNKYKPNGSIISFIA